MKKFFLTIFTLIMAASISMATNSGQSQANVTSVNASTKKAMAVVGPYTA